MKKKRIRKNGRNMERKEKNWNRRRKEMKERIRQGSRGRRLISGIKSVP
jgi:hypothetical protein